MNRPQLLNGIRVPYGEPTDELRRKIENGCTKERWASIRALAIDESEQSLNLLSTYTSNSDPNIRRAAIEAAGLNPNGASLISAIRRALTDTTPVVVRAACDASAKLKLFDLHNEIRELTESSNPHVQVSALKAIGVLWRPDCFDTVLGVFRSKTADEVHKQAGFILYQNADVSCWYSLFKVWHADSVPRHRTWACELAAKFSSGQLESELLILSEDKDGHVRDAALRAQRASRNLE